nr:NFACT family protein [Oligoflexales bacterium]
MSKDILRLGKCYQGKSPFIFWPILSPRSAGEKLFLLISAGEKKTRAIRMITEKEKPSPELLRDGASFSSLLRKYVPKAIIKGVREDLGGDIWIPLFEHSEQEQANWFILIRFESPGEISLISVEKQETLIRIGPKGSFTHRKALHFPVPSADDLKLISFHSVDRVEELFHQETRKDSQETEDKSVPKEKLATKEHESLNPMLREARQKLSRRVRTLRKACERLETSLVKPEDVAKLRAQAEALQNFAYLLKGGEKELLIKPLEENRGEEWLIPLDESLSTGANIQHYFKRVKKAETTESTTTAVWRKARSELESAEGALDKLRAQDEFPENEVLALLKRQGLSLEPAVKQQRREQDSGQSHFRTFHSLSSNALL